MFFGNWSFFLRVLIVGASAYIFLVQPEEWPGSARIAEAVTPLWARIENHSNNTVRVRYNEFALIGMDNRQFSALPLRRIQGDVQSKVPPAGGDPDFKGFGHRGSPYFRRDYPGAEPFDRKFGIGSMYNRM